MNDTEAAKRIRAYLDARSEHGEPEQDWISTIAVMESRQPLPLNASDLRHLLQENADLRAKLAAASRAAGIGDFTEDEWIFEPHLTDKLLILGEQDGADKVARLAVYIARHGRP